LPDISSIQDRLLSNSLEQIFSRLFPAIEHVFLRIYEPDLCKYFNKYFFPWKSLLSLQINYIFHRDNKEDGEKIRNEWKEKYLNEILPRQSRRNFTFTDVDEKLNIWFGESLTDEELNHEKVR
jgi:hypothetical protein